jgi:hypothetical protein
MGVRAFGSALAVAAGLAVTPDGALGASSRWEVEARLGGAWNAPLPASVRQEGHRTLRWTAHWSTRALDLPLYYGGRIVRWRGDSGWAIDLVHHKLHLDHPPPEIRRFSISHGYNLVTLQRLARRGPWRYGVALGAVVAHPESEIRGVPFVENRGLFRAGYYVTGPTAGAAIARSHALGRRTFTAIEARVTQSFARVPIAGGSARVPNLALHATAGLGWSLGG